MVARISIGNSVYGAISYNGEKVNQGKGKILGVNKVFYPPGSELNISQCANDFCNQIPSHHNVQKPVIHISLNPHPKDKLTDVELTSIAQEYLEKLGYGNQPYMIFKHEDIERSHIHIVSLRVDEQGRKIDDRFEFHRSDKIRRELEKKYRLIPAEKQKNTERYELKKVDFKKGNLKGQISNILKTLENYHFQSINEYRNLLSLYNIDLEEIKGTIGNRQYKGLIYSALNQKRNKVSKPFKSSLFGKPYGYDATLKRCTEAKALIKSKHYREQTKQLITSVMQIHHDRRNFEQNLKRLGIDVIFRENEDNRIYGATFVDHNNECVFNGSRLGKEYSANSFQEYFSGYSTEQQENNLTHESPADASVEAISSLGGLFSMGGQGINPEEEAFIRKMQRKKKRPKHL